MPPSAPPPLFRQRNFTALWGGQLISILGERLSHIAVLGLLSEHTDNFADPVASSVLLALHTNMMVWPVLLFSPFTGAWVDRVDVRRLMLGSDFLRGVIVALIPIAYLTTHHIGPVMALVFLLFTCNVFFLPAKSAITPELVPPTQLLTANALLSAAGIAASAMVLAGGWIVDHYGWEPALYVNTATYMVSVVSLALIVYRPRAHPAHAHGTSVAGYLRDVGEGWALVRHNPHVVLALLALGSVWFAGGFAQVAGVQHVQHAAQIPGMLRVGALVGALAVGAGAATWWVNARGRGLPKPFLLGGGLLLTGAALVLFAFSTHFVVFAAAALLAGLGAAPGFLLSETLMQLHTEPHQRGRAFSARDFLMRLLLLASAALAGTLVPNLGTTGALACCGVLVGGAGLLAIEWGRRSAELRAG